MCKKAWGVAKINIRHLPTPYILTGIITFAILAQIVVSLVIHQFGGNVGNQSTISAGNVLWLLPVLAGIFIPGRNFRRIMNLGAKRGDFFWGSLMAHAIIAAASSLAVMIFFYAMDNPINAAEVFASFTPHDVPFIHGEPGHIGGIANLAEVFRWSHNGPIVAFLQQFAWLFFLGTLAHTVTAMQDKWYGWAVDVFLICIPAVFVPIRPLRQGLVWFFNMTLTHDIAVVQIAVCLALGMAIYMLNKPALARKAI